MVKITGQTEECGQCPPQKHADPRQVSGVPAAYPTLTIQPPPGCWLECMALVSPHCTIFRPTLYSWLNHEAFFTNQLKGKVC